MNNHAHEYLSERFKEMTNGLQLAVKEDVFAFDTSQAGVLSMIKGSFIGFSFSASGLMDEDGMINDTSTEAVKGNVMVIIRSENGEQNWQYPLKHVFFDKESAFEKANMLMSDTEIVSDLKSV